MDANRTDAPSSPRFHRTVVVRYVVALAGVLTAYLVRRGMDPILGDRSALELFLVAVAFSAWYGGFGPAVTATIIALVVGTWSFVPPRKMLWIEDPADRVEAGAFLFAALCIAWLVRSLRIAQGRAEGNAALAEKKQVELIQEIGHRTQAEMSVLAYAQETERHRSNLEAVLDAAPVAIWVAHDRDCRQVTGNRLAHALFGDWEGNLAVRVRSEGKDLAPRERPLNRAALTGQPALRMEFELIRADGQSVWVLSNAVPLLDDRGNVRGAVSIWAEVTELKHAEAIILDLNSDLEKRVLRRTEELRRALDELSSYAYSIAHDLRAPLRAMAGFTQLLVEESRDTLPPQCGDYAGRIIDSAKRMDEMILDLLQYSRISREIYPVQEVDPYEVCSEVVLRHSEELQRRSGEIHVTGPIGAISGHRDLVREILEQLISNAVKFVPSGVPPKIQVRSEVRGQAVRIWIEDNGIGIRPEYLERIFGVFQTLHQRGDYPGTGMGLAIVRRAVERMEGRCGVESEPGQGSRFWVELPQAIRETPQGAASVGDRAFLKF